MWHTTLLHQFHDILPGTSIAWVHREARETYGRLESEARALIERAQRALVGEGDASVVFNGSPFEIDGVPAGGAVSRADGETVRPPVELTPIDGGWRLRNDLIEVEVTAAGLIRSAIDLASGRDAIFPGRAANELHLHQDFPNKWDAWDIDPFYRNAVRTITESAASSADLVDGVAVVSVERPISAASSVNQRISLRPGSREVVIEQTTQWHEDEKLLKIAFPLAVRAEHTSAETQFGVVTRPTHTNTSWDDARFETSMHRFVHAAEPGFAVAVTNDSSYGYDATRIRSHDGWGIELRPSVLRSPQFPDPGTDRGTHHHRFGLVVGASLDDAARYGAHANSAPNVLRGSGAVEPLAVAVGAGIAVSSVKLAADRSGDLVVRVHEYLGARTTGELRVSGAASAQRASLLEDRLEAHERVDAAGESGTVIPLTLAPFEVRTYRVTPAAG